MCRYFIRDLTFQVARPFGRAFPVYRPAGALHSSMIS